MSVKGERKNKDLHWIYTQMEAEICPR